MMTKKKRAQARTHTRIFVSSIFGSRVNERAYKTALGLCQSATARAILVSSHAATTTTCHTWLMVHSFHLLLLLVCCFCRCRRHCPAIAAHVAVETITQNRLKNDDKHSITHGKTRRTIFFLLTWLFKWRNIAPIFNCPFVLLSLSVFRNKQTWCAANILAVQHSPLHFVPLLSSTLWKYLSI